MKKSFFKKLTRAINPHDTDESFDDFEEEETPEESQNHFLRHTNSDGELTVDVFETSTHIVVKAIIAGVRKDDLEISVSRDMLTIKGKREEFEEVGEENYFHRELFWGSFSRTILLPQEVDIDRAEATEDKGMLTLKLPKVDKTRQARIKVKSN